MFGVRWYEYLLAMAAIGLLTGFIVRKSRQI